ncbi:hypothetical protein ACFQL7_05330 [Halocatena marina]|uniref:Helix-turn-helix type 11 domain-containing protein n=1 Tax=Halocatena marina TaxID=2934937 RepID=A0ABD5YNV6_9EURY
MNSSTNNRKRNEHGQFDDKIPSESALGVFESREDQARPLTATDVMEALDCSRRTAHNKLNMLVEKGVLATRKVGARSRVWWIPIENASMPNQSETTEQRHPRPVSNAIQQADLLAKAQHSKHAARHQQQRTTISLSIQRRRRRTFSVMSTTAILHSTSQQKDGGTRFNRRSSNYQTSIHRRNVVMSGISSVATDANHVDLYHNGPNQWQNWLLQCV